MKKQIFLFVIACLAGVFVYAQGTLQFNQVKLVSSEETVPMGKVWKVVSVFPSKSFTIDQPYSIKINNQEVYTSQYNVGEKYWDNITSIVFDAKFQGGTCTGSCGTKVAFNYSGSENGLPFGNRTSIGASFITTSNTSFQNQFTVIPVVGSTISISAFKLYVTNNGSCMIPIDIKMTVNYNDGSSQIAYYQGGCCCGNSSIYILGSSSANFEVAASSRDYFTSELQFPFWLPAGTTLAAFSNISGISIIEFNVVQ